ncbi:MAG: cytidine deaminase [Tannerella sp.]|jgi:cytidine deaminase|nr:cytidine deaminase [Tannerella sp.]
MTIELNFSVLCNEDLSPSDAHLREAALEAASRAYAPYSHFNVGAAVALADGNIVTGNNQENIAYPSGLCAERVALFAAGASYPDTPVTAIAIIAVSNGVIQDSVSPCGVCRQTLIETQTRYKTPIKTLMCGANQTIISHSATDLLPLCFRIP